MMRIFLLPLGIQQKSLLTQGIPCSIENLKNKRTKKTAQCSSKGVKKCLGILQYYKNVFADLHEA